MKNAKEMAREMSDFVNNMTCPIDKFVEAMSNEHRTLQQTFTSLCFAWIKANAEKYENKDFDGCNEYSCRVSADIAAKVEDVNYKAPFI